MVDPPSSVSWFESPPSNAPFFPQSAPLAPCSASWQARTQKAPNLAGSGLRISRVWPGVVVRQWHQDFSSFCSG